MNKLLLEGLLYQITEIKACSLARWALFVHTFYGKLFRLVSKEFRLVHKLIPRSSTDVENQQKIGPFDTTLQLCKKIFRIYFNELLVQCWKTTQKVSFHNIHVYCLLNPNSHKLIFFSITKKNPDFSSSLEAKKWKNDLDWQTMNMSVTSSLTRIIKHVDTWPMSIFGKVWLQHDTQKQASRLAWLGFFFNSSVSQLHK